jgi:hypothetical protein
MYSTYLFTFFNESQWSRPPQHIGGKEPPETLFTVVRCLLFSSLCFFLFCPPLSSSLVDQDWSAP